MQEVSSAHITKRKSSRRNLALKAPFGKEQIYKEKLNPHYVAGFIDGEGCFSVSVGRHKTLKRGLEIRPEFDIELRADDKDILERILITIGCGKIYDQSYERYGWFPHAKYKITSTKDMVNFLFPFLDKYPLQAKKAEVYRYFKGVVIMYVNKEHLTDEGLRKIIKMREEIRKIGKKARTYSGDKPYYRVIETARVRENRLPSGVKTFGK